MVARLNTGTSLAVKDWLPDELLFSFCSREHVASGNLLSRTTTLKLFGHGRNGVQHDFPKNLTFFCQAAGAALCPSCEYVCCQHTILPFYMPWRSKADVALALSLAAGNLGSIKHVFGLLSSRFGASHPLKLCLACCASDRERWGTAYWHVSHQYPGVWVCNVHGQQLLSSMDKAMGNGRFLWALPDVARIMHSSVVDDSSIPQSGSLSHVIISASQLPLGTHIDYSRLKVTYVSKLTDLGFSKGKRSLRMRDVAAEYLSFLKTISHIPETLRLPSTLEGCCTSLSSLLLREQVSSHPLRQLIFIYWLFGQWETFWSMYSSCTVDECDLDCLPIAPARKKRHAQWERALQMLRSGTSSRGVAKSLCIDVHTVQHWAADSGIGTKKRNINVRERVAAALRRGLDKQVVALRQGLSVQSITRILRSEVGLHEEWRQSIQGRRRERARAAWLRAEHKVGSSGVQKIRKLAGAEFAWLYRNDREWLIAHSPSRSVPAKQSRDRVDWNERDMRLSEALRIAAISLRQGSDSAVSANELFKYLPELHRLRFRLKKLPLTQRLFDDLLGKSMPKSGCEMPS